ncbi:DUF6036 family nucleotidyltransferase [Planctomycetota bacterium]
MKLQERALKEIVEALEVAGAEYMVIGGLASAVWGAPRATLDVDVLVDSGDSEVRPLLEELCKSFEPLATDPLAFAEENEFLPLRSKDGVQIDVILATLPFEREALARARALTAVGTAVGFCSPEDLVLMKVGSERSLDHADGRKLLARRKSTLDLDYLVPRVERLSASLGRPVIAERFKAWQETE